MTGENFRLFTSLEIPFGRGLSGWVAEQRKPILNGNPSVEPGYLNLNPAVQSCDASSAAMFAPSPWISFHHPLGEPRLGCDAQ